MSPLPAVTTYTVVIATSPVRRLLDLSPTNLVAPSDKPVWDIVEATS